VKSAKSAGHTLNTGLQDAGMPVVFATWMVVSSWVYNEIETCSQR
jgi:hypothetical protein